MSVLPRSDNRTLSCDSLSATGVPTSLPETARTCSPSATRSCPTAGSEPPASSWILKAARLSAMDISPGISDAASLCSQVSITRSGASMSGRSNPPCRTATAWSRAASISLAATYYSPFDLPNPEDNRRPEVYAPACFRTWFPATLPLGARDGHHRVHDVVGVVAVEEAPGVSQFVLQCPLDVFRPHPELLRDTHVEQDDALDRVTVLERDVGGARHEGLVRVAPKAYGIDRHVTIRVRDARVYLLRARVIRHYHQGRGRKQG